MDCKRAEEQLVDFLYGELTPEEQTAYENHLQTCDEHAKQVAQMRQVLDIVRGQEAQEPSPVVVQNIVQAARESIEEAARPAFWTRWIFNPVAIGATLILVVATLGLVFFQSTGTHSDRAGLAQSDPEAAQLKRLAPVMRAKAVHQADKPADAIRATHKAEDMKSGESKLALDSDGLKEEEKREASSRPAPTAAMPAKKALPLKDYSPVETKAEKPAVRLPAKPAPTAKSMPAEEKPASKTKTVQVAQKAPSGDQASNRHARRGAKRDAKRQDGDAQNRSTPADKAVAPEASPDSSGRMDLDIALADDVATKERESAAGEEEEGQVSPVTADVAKPASEYSVTTGPKASGRKFSQPPPSYDSTDLAAMPKAPASRKTRPKAGLETRTQGAGGAGKMSTTIGATAETTADRARRRPKAKKAKKSKDQASSIARSKDSTSTYRRAQKSMRATKYSQAVAEFKAALAADPYGPLAANCHYNIAKALFLSGKCQQSIAAAKKALAKAPRHNMAAETMLDQASCYIRNGKFEQALRLYQRVKRDYPTHKEEAQRAIDRLRSTQP